MKRLLFRLTMLMALLLPAMVAAQLLPGTPGLPVPGGVGNVGGIVDTALADAPKLPSAVAQLANDRVQRIADLVRANPTIIDRDELGNAARAGEVVVDSPDDALIASAARAGFTLIERQMIDGVDIGYARFRVPPRQSLARAVKAMRKLAGDRSVTADQIYFQSGKGGAGRARPAPASPASSPPATGARIGIIDGGVSDRGGIAATIVRAGFARGAGGASNHGSAVASLLVGTPAIRGSAPGARLWAADVYGTDPAGGNALAIARAIGWLTAQQVPVVVISLVGPANPILAKVVAAAQSKGMMIVAAVGNDGPAAPPSYPASFRGVVAVTGVDGQNRALIEAGNALHLDYAAPGADMLASDAGGQAVAVRGTSFAAPLVAGQIARRYGRLDPRQTATVLRQIDGMAIDLGSRGPDQRFGRGLVCADCRTPAR